MRWQSAQRQDPVPAAPTSRPPQEALLRAQAADSTASLTPSAHLVHGVPMAHPGKSTQSPSPTVTMTPS